MHRICAHAGARSRASIRAAMFLVGLCAVGLAGCGGGGGGGGGNNGSSNGGSTTPKPSNQPGTVVIAGTPAQGQQLTATVQDGNGVPGTVIYEWLADGSAISGATSATFTPTQAQVGKAVSVRATYTDQAGFAENVTSATVTIADANAAPTLKLATSSFVTTDFSHGNDIIYGLETLADDKILAVGRTVTGKNGTADFALVRYLPDGSLDATFGNGGKVVTDFSGYADNIYSRPVVMSDGRILVAGGAGTSLPDGSSNADIGIARYLANGSLDTSFGGTGKVHIDIAGLGDWANAVAIDKQSRIVVAGGATNPATLNYQFVAIRLTPEGNLDSTFGNGGKVIVDFDPGNITGLFYANDMLVQADGRILLSGDAGDNFGLVRLNTDGSLDTTFGTAGIIRSSSFRLANRMALRPDGKILVTGGGNRLLSNDTSHVVVAQFNADGTTDYGFGMYGIVETDVVGPIGSTDPISEGYDIRILSNDHFVVVGTVNDSVTGGRQNMVVADYYSNGTLNGYQTIDLSGDADLGYAVAVTRDGNLLVGGRAMNHQDYSGDFAIAKVDAIGNPKTLSGLYRAIYLEGGDPTPMAPHSVASDEDLPANGNYAGFTLTVQRHETPSTSDNFFGIGSVYFNGGSVTIDGRVVGQYTENGGVLTVTLNSNSKVASNDLATVASSIGYYNTDLHALGLITMDWRLSDEAGNSTAASSEVVIANDYANAGDLRMDFFANIDFENALKADTGTDRYYYTTVRKVSHNFFDTSLNASIDTNDTSRTKLWATAKEYANRQVSLATLSELQALRATASLPTAYASGEYWTATLAAPGQHYVIDMATGSTRIANDTESLMAVMFVN